MSVVLRIDDYRRPRNVREDASFFTRDELDSLLTLYSRRVALGEWRDYAIDYHDGLSAFSVFRNSMERPLYTIAKRIGGKSGEYLLYSRGERLARAKSLGEVLAAFERKLRVIS